MSTVEASTVAAHPGQTPDQIMVTALRAGDDESFRSLVREHHVVMGRIARAYLPSTSEADNVVRDAWRHALENIAEIETSVSMRAWLIGKVAVAARARASQLRVADSPELDRAADACHRRRDDTTSVDATAQGALTRLPADEQSVTWLRDVYHWSATEVDGALALTGCTQRVLLHRARTFLRVALGSTVEAATEAARSRCNTSRARQTSSPWSTELWSTALSSTTRPSPPLSVARPA